jgi:RNA polymerase-binding protein DksA
MLKTAELHEFREQLEERYAELREEIRQDLLDTEEEHFIDLAGQVRDLEEQSVASLLVDLDLELIDRKAAEARDIESALARVDNGRYGVCIDCGDDIALARLRAFPTAKRCRPCQDRHERSHAGHETPSL